MDNVIKVTPDKNGKLFITLYGTRYQIVVEDVKPKSKPIQEDGNVENSK